MRVRCMAVVLQPSSSSQPHLHIQHTPEVELAGPLSEGAGSDVHDRCDLAGDDERSWAAPPVQQSQAAPLGQLQAGDTEGRCWQELLVRPAGGWQGRAGQGSRM